MGTGFCLDPECRLIGTNYHVAVAAKCRKVEGTRIVRRYLATGPTDEDATLNDLSGGPPERYTLSRDLAVFELARPLAHHHGLGFSTDDLVVGQHVGIYAYPIRTADPFRTLQVFHATFKGPTSSGLLAFDYAPDGHKVIRPGASGGIVIDSSTGKIVGILDGLDRRGRMIALAVPVESLAGFLQKELPFLAQALFPISTEVPEDQPDLYGKYDPAMKPVDLQRRPTEPNDVTELRKKAQSLADGMQSFIAVQTFVWGRGNHPPVGADAYEVQVHHGAQMFREYPSGKRWSLRSPRPQGATSAISPGDVWSTLPLFIGTHAGVNIHEASATELGGRRTRVFQYLGSAEDNPCVVGDVFDFGFFSIEKQQTYTAYGEVWTDQDLNIVRMSLHCEKDGQQKWQDVMNFGWLTRPGIERRIVPVTLVAWSPMPDKGLWCRSQFVCYREFASHSRLLYGQFRAPGPPASQRDQHVNKARQP
ncbi:MAG: S1 family peptidase [Candidatus Acidiferrales bacterium]